MSQPTKEEFKEALEYLLSLPVIDKVPLIDPATLAIKASYGNHPLPELTEQQMQILRNTFGGKMLGWKDQPTP